jgi:hypothetical protein
MRFPIRISPPWKPLLSVLGMSAKGSYVDVDVDAGTMRVKCGVWFDESLPLAAITHVEPSSWPWYGGLGVKLGPTKHAVSVVGSLDGVVAIHFAEPQRMHVLVVVNRPELRISLEDPEGFMRTIREALGTGGSAEQRNGPPRTHARA